MSIKCSVELSNNIINNIVKFILENCFATSIVAFILIWINLASFFLTDNLCNMKDIHMYMKIFIIFTFLTRILLNLSMVYIYNHKICNSFTILFQNYWFGVVGGIILHISIIYFMNNLDNIRRNFILTQNESREIEMV